ncbi:hypothetical protein, partial [Burkholderia gladioli]|uniref:hypothetical protein n=1 Tax=Burkholderia gladioli TaxID=28095 RepID=UPI001ABA64CF
STATICSIEKRLRFMANHLLVQGQVCRKTRSRIGPGFLTQINLIGNAAPGTMRGILEIFL